MRLPCLPDAETKTHFLTDFYASTERFKLPLTHFANYSEKAYLKFYNENAVRIEGELYGKRKSLHTSQGSTIRPKGISVSVT